VRRRAALAAVPLLLLAPWGRAAEGTLLPAVDDVQALAAQSARAGIPIIVLFTTPGCPFCQEARQNYLAPRLAEQQRRSKPEYLLREVDITSRRPVGTIDGRVLTEAQLADRYGIHFAPVLMAFDSRWRPLGEPLVGLDRAGFYESYVERLISAARQSNAAR
jgi:thiol-disulfide isomerase/thioredoxin